MLQSFSRPQPILAICCPLKKNACLLTTGNPNGAIGLTAYAVSNTTKAALRWPASLLEGGSHRHPSLRDAFEENSKGAVHHTIVGSRPEEARLKADALAQKIRDSVDFISWLPQNNLFELYDSHDLLLFPSLHDSSGGVVLEALCHGMPVVCPDLGGPKDIVTSKAGVVIKTTGLNTTQAASNIANEVYNVFESPTTLTQFSSGAISRASEFILPNRVARFYQEALRFIEGDGTCSAPVSRSRAEAPVAPFPADGA